ncbi:hypothetical protein D3C80_2186430 [compost metagenome]
MDVCGAEVVAQEIAQLGTRLGQAFARAAIELETDGKTLFGGYAHVQTPSMRR